MSKFSPRPFKFRSAQKKASVPQNNFVFSRLKEHLNMPLLTKCICAFLLSRTTLIGGAHPLGFAMFAASFGSEGTYLYALSAILGLILSGAGLLSTGKYIIAIIAFSLIAERFLPQKFKSANLISVISAICVLITGLFLLFADMTFGGYPLIYDSMVLIVECATVYIASRAFTTAISLMFNLKLRRTLTSEETVCLAFFAGGILCGLGTAGFFGFFSFTGTLCVLCVLIFAVRYGGLHGCSVGIIMGIVHCLSRGRIDACAASFALSGLCAGFFSRYGKWSACVSFILSNAVVTILANSSTEVLINIFDTVLATIILYCMPQKVFDSINNFSPLAPPAFELAASKLSSAEKTISNLEKSFEKIFSLRNSKETNTLLLYQRSARRSCGSCGLRKYCWGRDIKATKEAMDELCALLQNNEDFSAQNAPPHCLRGEQFVAEFKRMFEVYKNDCMWTDKISEFRKAVYSSFSGIAEILGKSSEALLFGDECDTAAADELRCRLRKEGILAKNIFVCGKKEETKIHLKLESCGGFGRCENAVCKVLEATFNMPFVRTGLRNCSDCMCSYVIKPSFSITTAVAGAIKNNKKSSGDYVIYSLLDRHTYAIILCDGMGSGDIAREESRTSAQLLMKLLETGIEPQAAINLINSMLLCSFTGTLAAIDLCLISLDDGSCSIYKCGGASTYAKTKEEVSQISAKTLPAGTFVLGDAEVFSIPSEKGSMVVLLSDGVSSCETSRLPWIKNMIFDYNGTEPEALAQMILNKAKENLSASPTDDLTVVAAYIG